MVDVEPLQTAWCSLCSMLHQADKTKTSKTVDLVKILDKNNCKLPPYIEMEVESNSSEVELSKIIILLVVLKVLWLSIINVIYVWILEKLQIDELIFNKCHFILNLLVNVKSQYLYFSQPWSYRLDFTKPWTFWINAEILLQSMLKCDSLTWIIIITYI